MTKKFVMSKKLKLGLPKGSLQEAAIQKLAKADYNITAQACRGAA